MDDEREPRVLVVTVGTSLFSSAPWEAAGPLHRLVTHDSGYSTWVEDPRFREQPGLRRTEGFRTAEWLKERLLEDPLVFDKHLEWKPDWPERYPAEINTLIRLFMKEPYGDETFEEFLRLRYSKIELVCGSSQRDDSHVAGRWLAHLLGTKLGHPACELKAILRSGALRDKVDQFRSYLTGLPRQRVDLLVTGGYKVFALMAGFFAGRLAPGAWRLLYLHEEQQNQLVVSAFDEQGNLRQSYDEGGGSQIIETPPGPVGT